MTMREKMARAMYARSEEAELAAHRCGLVKDKYEIRQGEYLWDSILSNSRAKWLALVDAAINALMEPTKEMCATPRAQYAAGELLIRGLANEDDCEAIFKTMIRAAKDGK